MIENVDYESDYNNQLPDVDLTMCKNKCSENSDCQGFSYNKENKSCMLKNKLNTPIISEDSNFYYKNIPTPLYT
jgi:hypothetical protein